MILENSLKRLVRLKNSNSSLPRIERAIASLFRLLLREIALGVRPMPLHGITDHEDEPRLGKQTMHELDPRHRDPAIACAFLAENSSPRSGAQRPAGELLEVFEIPLQRPVHMRGKELDLVRHHAKLGMLIKCRLEPRGRAFRRADDQKIGKEEIVRPLAQGLIDLAPQPALLAKRADSTAVPLT